MGSGVDADIDSDSGDDGGSDGKSDHGLGFGVRLRVARERAGLTQVKLGELSGYSGGWISAIETGNARARRKFAENMEHVLGEQMSCIVDLGSSVLVESRRVVGVGNWGMTPTEVSKYLAVSRTTIYDWMDKGRLPFVILDGLRRIYIEDCAKWIVMERRGYKYEFVIVRASKNVDDETQHETDGIREWLRNERTT